MASRMHATKLVVRDLERAERFYASLGLAVLSRNVGGDGDVHQAQTWFSTTGAEDAHILILTQFLDLPTPARPDYPGEIWTCFQVEDVDSTVASVAAQGGEVHRTGADQPAFQVRAAVVRDPEGHLIELVGPMKSTTESKLNMGVDA